MKAQPRWSVPKKPQHSSASSLQGAKQLTIGSGDTQPSRELSAIPPGHRVLQAQP